MDGMAGRQTFEIIKVNRYKVQSKSKKRQLASIGYHILGLIAFMITVWSIFTLTGISPTSGFMGEIQGKVNLVPLNGIVGVIDTALETKSYVWAVKNILGNILMFIPVGFFLPMLYSSYRTIWKVTAFGAILSIAIECWQLFLIRSTDVDDCILNIMGTILGFIVYAFFEKAVPEFCKKFRAKRMLESIAAVVVIAGMIVIRGFIQIAAL